MRRGLIIVLLSLIVNFLFAQENTTRSIEVAMEQHLLFLKTNFPHIDNIFINIRMDDKISLPSKAFKIENGVNAKFINKKDQNLLVVVTIGTQTDYLQLDVVNFSVVKKSNRKVNLINLNNGKTYKIKSE